MDLELIKEIMKSAQEKPQEKPKRWQTKEQSRYSKVMHEYGEATRKSQFIRAELLKESAEGKPAEALLLKAAECISLMTGDKGFYTQMKDNYRKNSRSENTPPDASIQQR